MNTEASAFIGGHLSSSVFPQWRQRLSVRHELQGDAVVAPALAGGRRAVLEDVALMPAAARAVILGARVDELEVPRRGHVGGGDGFEEARPAGAAVELAGRAEQGQVAAGA